MIDIILTVEWNENIYLKKTTKGHMLKVKWTYFIEKDITSKYLEPTNIVQMSKCRPEGLGCNEGHDQIHYHHRLSSLSVLIFSLLNAY